MASEARVSYRRGLGWMASALVAKLAVTPSVDFEGLPPVGGVEANPGRAGLPRLECPTRREPPDASQCGNEGATGLASRAASRSELMGLAEWHEEQAEKIHGEVLALDSRGDRLSELSQMCDSPGDGYSAYEWCKAANELLVICNELLGVVPKSERIIWADTDDDGLPR